MDILKEIFNFSVLTSLHNLFLFVNTSEKLSTLILIPTYSCRFFIN